MGAVDYCGLPEDSGRGPIPDEADPLHSTCSRGDVDGIDNMHHRAHAWTYMGITCSSLP